MANRQAFTQRLRENAALFVFMLLYAAVYLPAIAFRGSCVNFITRSGRL